MLDGMTYNIYEEVNPFPLPNISSTTFNIFLHYLLLKQQFLGKKKNLHLLPDSEEKGHNDFLEEIGDSETVYDLLLATHYLDAREEAKEIIKHAPRYITTTQWQTLPQDTKLGLINSELDHWTTDKHFLFPEPIKIKVKTLLLLWSCGSSLLSEIPKEILFMIIEHVVRQDKNRLYLVKNIPNWLLTATIPPWALPKKRKEEKQEKILSQQLNKDLSVEISQQFSNKETELKQGSQGVQKLTQHGESTQMEISKKVREISQTGKSKNKQLLKMEWVNGGLLVGLMIVGMLLMNNSQKVTKWIHVLKLLLKRKKQI